ncbi:ORF6C domain-containing protein [Halobacillus seohaensis]|uniref:ORF6C domain-containing protein n=1 Tax=Halobacillus seohaensis TaxID=447421 RepID=A0ABW2EJT7_9BACI
MNQLTEMFNGHQLRVIEQDNELFFLLKDVCEILNLGNPRQVKTRLEDDVISNYPIQDSLGRTQQATFINEDGLYDVILDSRKPESKCFRKWVTSEVLPSIRKTGSYEAQQPKVLSDKEQLMASMKLSIEHNEKIEQHDERITFLEETMRIDGSQEYKIKKRASKKIMEVIGGRKAPAYSEMSRQVFSAFWRDFKNHFTIPRYSELPKKQFAEGIRFIELWQPDTSLRMEIESTNQQQVIRGVI